MAEPNSSSKDWYKALEWFVAIALAVLIAVGIRTFLFVPYQVHGASMEPTLKGDELLIVNKLVYHWMIRIMGRSLSSIPVRNGILSNG